MCTNKLFSFPASSLNCLKLSNITADSMSPTVPPISVIIMSALLVIPASYILFFISLAIWGTI